MKICIRMTSSELIALTRALALLWTVMHHFA